MVDWVLFLLSCLSVEFTMWTVMGLGSLFSHIWSAVMNDWRRWMDDERRQLAAFFDNTTTLYRDLRP
jgi:predicted alpha/beta hydrolase